MAFDMTCNICWCNILLTQFDIFRCSASNKRRYLKWTKEKWLRLVEKARKLIKDLTLPWCDYSLSNMPYRVCITVKSLWLSCPNKIIDSTMEMWLVDPHLFRTHRQFHWNIFAALLDILRCYTNRMSMPMQLYCSPKKTTKSIILYYTENTDRTHTHIQMAKKNK